METFKFKRFTERKEALLYIYMYCINKTHLIIIATYTRKKQKLKKPTKDENNGTFKFKRFIERERFIEKEEALCIFMYL